MGSQPPSLGSDTLPNERQATEYSTPHRRWVEVPGRVELTAVDAGVRMRSYVVGSPDRGELLLIPGLCVSSYLRPAADALAASGFRVHLVDPPGWPRSDAPPTPPADAADIAEWVVRWMTEADLRDITLVGQSFGAQLAAHVAAQAPQRVLLLLLQGPTFDPAYRTMPRAAWRLACDFPRERPSLLALEAPEWLRLGLRQVRGVVRIGLRDRLETTVRRVRCPVLVAVGEHDTLSTRAWTRSLVDPRLVRSRHVVMTGLPHSSPHADPVGFARLVVTMTEDVAGSRAPHSPPGPQSRGEVSG